MPTLVNFGNTQIEPGKYVIFAGILWVVVDNNLIVKKDISSEGRFFNSRGSYTFDPDEASAPNDIPYYINHAFYDSLGVYKTKVKERTWTIKGPSGNYTRTCKVGLLNHSYWSSYFGTPYQDAIFGLIPERTTGANEAFLDWANGAANIYTLKPSRMQSIAASAGSHLIYRPVVELVPNFTISSGDGSYANPYTLSFNTLPTLTLSSPVNNQTLAEGSTYTLSGTVSDVEEGSALSVRYSIAGGPTQSISVGTSDGETELPFSKTLTYAQGRFWDGSTDVSGLLPAETASIQVWANDSIDDSAKVTRNFTIQQDDGKVYVPVNVVTSAYLISRMAPPVRLSNGWLVGAAYSSSDTTIYLYVSKDNGKVWTQLCHYKYSTIAVNGWSLNSKGTMIYLSATHSDGYSWVVPFTVFTGGINIFSLVSRVALDSVQTALGGVTSSITPDGTRLWWAASTKNSSYPNSFNIRAGYIPINADGSLGTPSAVMQVTTYDLSSLVTAKNPYILVKSDGNPILAFEGYNGSNYYTQRYRFDGSTSWVAAGGYNDIYPKNLLTACLTPNGKIHEVWHGTDSTDTTNAYIRYSNSTNGTTWLPTPRKLVKGTNASITSDKNGKLYITYEDSGVIKRIESTDEFATYQGPFVVGAGTVPASMYDPTFSTEFTVPPTFYQAANAVKYYGALIVNKKPVVTLNTPDNQTLTEQATLSVSGTALDEDNGNVVTVKYKINTSAARAIASGVSDGSTPISFARTLTYSNKRLWDGAVDVAGADLAENTDHTLTVWAEDDKGGKSAEVTRKFRVIWNRPPTISGENGDLGTIIERPTITYSAVDPEGNTFTFTEYLNGQQVRSFAGEAGQEYTFQLTHDAWIRLDLDMPHQAKIVATDSAGISSERVYTFTRTETHIEFMLDYENPEVQAFFTVDGMPNRILVTLERYLPPGAAIESVLVTNNYLDAEPTWEDATGAVIGGRGYLFTNTTKTADDWAVCVWVTIAKGSADQRVHVYGYGGAFD